MIKLSNGHELEWVVAAGALGWDGRGWPWERPLVKLGIIKPELFTITTKTLTLEPNKGNMLAVRVYRDGVWNNQGLPNKGLDWWINKYTGLSKQLPYKTLLSLAPENHFQMDEMLCRLSRSTLTGDPNLVGMELNVSCPNVHALDFATIQEIVKTYKACNYVSLPLIIKLNWDQVSRKGFTIEQLKELLSLCEAVSLNSVPNEYSAGKEGGAWSGKTAQLYNWLGAELLQNIGYKVIWPSVWEYADITKLKSRGAQAISFGSIHMLRPWAPTKYVERYRRENK